MSLDSNRTGKPFVYDGAPLVANATKEPAVNQKLMALGSSMERLEKELISLGSRLTPVFSPEFPTPAGDEKSPPEACPLAEQLQSAIRHAEYLRSMVEAYLSRLEV